MLDYFPRGVPQQNCDNAFPDASWWSPKALLKHDKWQYKQGAILVGKIGDTALGTFDDRHMMTVAGSRSGKGRSVIVPNMCLYPGSVITVDPKGDLATITAARRGKGSDLINGIGTDVYVLDPFEVTRGNARAYRAAFNPLDMIDVDGLYGRDDAALLADALIIPAHAETHWTDAAKMLLTGLILHVCTTQNPETRNLLTLRDYLTGDIDQFDELLSEMAVS